LTGRLSVRGKDGFRFTVVRVDSGQSEATIQMKSGNAPPEPFTGFEGQPSFEEQQALARRVLERLQKLPGIESNERLPWLVHYLARIDPSAAAKWSAALGGSLDQLARTQLAERALHTGDADEAIGLLSGIESDARRISKLEELIRDCLPDQPARALRLAEEAVVQSRALDDPLRSDCLLTIGQLVVEAGRRDAGSTLIQEAAHNAEALGSDGYDATVRQKAAARVAPYDLDLALRLVEPLGDRTAFAYGAVAVELSRTDLPKALEMLDRVSGQYVPDQFRRRMPYYVAARDPQAAISLTESISDPGYQALAYGWLAVALDSRDHALACQMIDRAFEVLRRTPGAGMSFSDGPMHAVFAARIAYQAHLIGYPDPALLTAYTLSLRPQQNAYSERRDFVHASLRAAVDSWR